MGRHTEVGVPLRLLENTHYAEIFRVAMGRVGGSGGLQVGLGEQPGVGEGHCRSEWQKQVGAAVVFSLAASSVRSRLKTSSFQRPLPAPITSFFVGCLKNQEGQLDPGLALVM